MNDVIVICPIARVTEISHLCSQHIITILEDEDVLRLDIAMNNTYRKLADGSI
jgi:hypothetical protein